MTNAIIGEQNLSDLATAAGQAWASWWADELRRAGRAMVGGWPGTMSEARGRVLDRLRELGAGTLVGSIDLPTLTRIAYVAARASWLAHAVPDRDVASDAPDAHPRSDHHGQDADHLSKEP